MNKRIRAKRFFQLTKLGIIASLSLSAGITQAQDNEVSSTESSSSSLDITYGPKIGLTSSGFYEGFWGGRQHTGGVTGVAIGGFASYKLLDFVSVSAELMYMQQGGTRVELKESLVDGSLITTTGNVKLHNVEFPVLVRASLPNPVLGFRPQLILGPSVGFNVAAVQSQDITYFVDEFNESPTGIEAFARTGSGTENVRSEYRSMQYGLNVGLGAEIPLEGGANTIIFDARYRYGINPINNGYDPNDLLRDASDIRSNTFLFSIGITL
ncbi:MAG: porin family protein [Cyclobacteriaceae bacterium]